PLATELPLPHPDPPELAGAGGREGLAGAPPRHAKLVRELADACLRALEGICGRRRGVGARVERLELRARLRCALEQLIVVATTEAALRVRDPLELRLDLLEPGRIGLERGK